MSLGENLQYLRERAGLTQEQLASRMEVSRQSVSKWESSASYPEMEKLVQLCQLFDVDLDTLVRGDAAAACVEDGAQYDRHMNWFSRMIAGGVGLVLLGVSVMMFLSGMGMEDNLATALFLTMMAVAVVVLIVAAMRHDRFERLNPVIEPFYSQAETERFERRFPLLIAAPVAAILIGVVWIVLFGERAERAGEAAEMRLIGLFMLVIAASVAVLIWSAIQKGKYNLEGWNWEHDPSPEATARRKKIGWICGCIMLAATAGYLAVGFGVMAASGDYGDATGWQWGWIVYPVAGVLCGIVSTVVNRDQ